MIAKYFDRSHRWRAVTFLTAGAAGLVTRWGIRGAWRRVSGSDAPRNPDAPGVSWSRAAAWAAAAGVAAGLARVLARRGTAAARKQAGEGSPPSSDAGVREGDRPE